MKNNQKFNNIAKKIHYIWNVYACNSSPWCWTSDIFGNDWNRAKL